MDRKRIIYVALFCFLVGVALGVYFTTKPKAEKGNKTVTVEVVYKDKTSKTYTTKTNAEYLSDLLVELYLVSNDEKSFFTTVDGVKADYSVDEGWWCITKNGEMTMYGAAELALADGDRYEITYTTGYSFD